MKHEEILTRSDGSKVNISVSLWADSLRGEFEYIVSVSLCGPRKRIWRDVFGDYNYTFRSLSLEERKKMRQTENLKHVTAEEILDLWCTPIYEKPRVKGWYNVYSDTNTLFGGQKTKEEAAAAHGIINRIGQIFIDQEIE